MPAEVVPAVAVRDLRALLLDVEDVALLDDALGLLERLGVRLGLGRLRDFAKRSLSFLRNASRAASASAARSVGAEQVRRRLAVAERDRGVPRPEERGVRLAEPAAALRQDLDVARQRGVVAAEQPRRDRAEVRVRRCPAPACGR